MGKPAGRKKAAQRPRRGIDGRQRSGRAAADTRRDPEQRHPQTVKKGANPGFSRAGAEIPGETIQAAQGGTEAGKMA